MDLCGQRIFDLIFTWRSKQRAARVRASISAHTDRKLNGRYVLAPTCQIPDLDKYYELYFPRHLGGTFVEVGEYDGEYASNTSGLADVGWKGFYIEPVPEYADRCRRRYAKNHQVTISQIAIGDASGYAHIRKAGPLSTASEEMVETFQMLDWAKPSITDDVIREEQIPPR